jgi:hypothetical protein
MAACTVVNWAEGSVLETNIVPSGQVRAVWQVCLDGLRGPADATRGLSKSNDSQDERMVVRLYAGNWPYNPSSHPQYLKVS